MPYVSRFVPEPEVGRTALRERQEMKRVTMNHINAYLDGALDDKERQEFEHSVEADAEAKAVLTFHKNHVDELHRLYDPVLEEPVPDRMLELLRRRQKS